MYGKSITIILLSMILCGVPIVVQAATWYVTTNGNDLAAGTSWDTALLTIAAGVTKASAPDDVVLVSNGVYVVTSQIQIAKDIVVRSLNGREVTIVNGNDPGTINRCFYLGWGATVDGFTITNGAFAGDYGGGVYMYAGAELHNCTVTGNRITGNFGGGVHMSDIAGGACVVSNCVINGNSAEWYGGGVSVLGNGLLKNCVISNNTTGARGAAVYVGNGRIEGCTIIDNTTSGDYGGGVNIWSVSSGFISNCTIIGNTCAGSGGGVFIYSTAAGAVRNCTILGNIAGNGGGIYTAAAILVENCRIGENQASGQGGGVYISNANAGTVLRNCLVDGNTATLYGGGISLAKPMTLQNCTIVSNSASMNPGLGGGGIKFGAAGVGCTSVNTIVYFNNGWGVYSNYIIAAGSASFSNSCVAPEFTGASALISSDNITNDPIFVAQHDGDYQLQLGSPCIGAGVNQEWMTNSLDLNGHARIRYGLVDMGCYEFVSPGSVFSFY